MLEQALEELSQYEDYTGTATKRRIGEPVRRPDNGSVLSLFELENGFIRIILGCPLNIACSYLPDEVKRIGDGDFTEGIIRIGQAYFKTEPETILSRSRRLLIDS